MIKLFKNESSCIKYAEIWKNNDLVCIHTGTVGEKGNYKTRKDVTYDNYKQNFINEYASKGYDEGTYYQLIVQFRTNKFLKSKQECIKLKDKVITILNEDLGWYGLGQVDGWDFGVCKLNYELNIFNYVVDVNIAKELIKKSMKLNKINQSFMFKVGSL